MTTALLVSARRVVELVVRASRPDPHLFILGVLDDAEFVLRRDDRHPRGDVARVPHLVGAVRADRKAHDVTRSERLLTGGTASVSPLKRLNVRMVDADSFASDCPRL